MKEFVDKLIERLAENRRPIVTNDEDLEWNRAMYLCTGIVNQLAEEYKLSEMQTGWIACSERLPEVSGEYYTYVYYDGHYMYSVDEIDCDGIIKEWNCSPDYQIIAWKPIEFYQPIGE